MNFRFKILKVLVLFLNVYLILRERDRVKVEEGQRERETQNMKQAPGSELSAQSLIQPQTHEP